MAPKTVFITGCNRGEWIGTYMNLWVCPTILWFIRIFSTVFLFLGSDPWCPGIGLELVRQYLALPSPPSHLFATYRSKERSGEHLDT